MIHKTTILIAGSGGFGREVLSTIIDDGVYGNVFFFNDKLGSAPELLEVYGTYVILTSVQEIRSVLRDDIPFVCAAGLGRHRKRLREKLQRHCTLTSQVSRRAVISPFSSIGNGSIIQPNSAVSNDVHLGECSLINTNAQIAHDTTVGDYVTIGSNVVILGRCIIGDFVSIHANSTILPNTRIGPHAIIAAGSIVDRDIQPFETFISGRR